MSKIAILDAPACNCMPLQRKKLQYSVFGNLNHKSCNVLFQFSSKRAGDCQCLDVSYHVICDKRFVVLLDSCNTTSWHNCLREILAHTPGLVPCKWHYSSLFTNQAYSHRHRGEITCYTHFPCNWVSVVIIVAPFAKVHGLRLADFLQFFSVFFFSIELGYDRCYS